MLSDRCPVLSVCDDVLWPNGWMDQDQTWHRGMPWHHIVIDENPAPLPKKGHSSPHFLVRVYCGQMAGWIKMPLGTEVDLGAGHTVLDGDPAPPIFGPCLLWPNGRPSQLLLCTCCKRHFINGPTYLGQHVTERNPLEITGAVFMGDISFLSTNKPHMSKH